MEIRSSSTARLARIVRIVRLVYLVRLSQGGKGQELLVVYYPSRIVRLALSVSHYPSLIASVLSCMTAERLSLLCLDLSVFEQTA